MVFIYTTRCLRPWGKTGWKRQKWNGKCVKTVNYTTIILGGGGGNNLLITRLLQKSFICFLHTTLSVAKIRKLQNHWKVFYQQVINSWLLIAWDLRPLGYHRLEDPLPIPFDPFGLGVVLRCRDAGKRRLLLREVERDEVALVLAAGGEVLLV